MSEPGPANALARLLRLMACLRDRQFGCAWDLQQDFVSIAPHTLEEVYEVVDAIERHDLAQLREELGDLLFQVVFHARLGEEAGAFDFESIVSDLTAKLLKRHPHVFPAGTLESFGTLSGLAADQVLQAWEHGKAKERRQRAGAASSALDDVPLALPALQRAAKLQKRAALQGFDWPDVDGVMAKLDEEVDELKQALQTGAAAEVSEEYGDLLFTIVNLGRHLDLSAEQVLRSANAKFERRFRSMEQRIQQQGQEINELSLTELEQFWQRAKREERS